MTRPGLLQLTADYQARVWGGQRLKPSPARPIGEAWIVYEGNRIAVGPWAGHTLAEAAAALGPALLGAPVVARTGLRFPLLIKLLDCRDWLSIQVHPDDAQAVALEGPGQFGKTEAWHILEAEPGARLIAGVKPGTSAEALAQAIRAGDVEGFVAYHAVHAGDSVFMPAGTLHALGPGLLLYEVQQTSDITYRVFDWNRPASAGRALHLEQAIAVTDPAAGGQIVHRPALRPDDQKTLLTCRYFTLEVLHVESRPRGLDTRGESFHALTLIAGQAEAAWGAERVTLERFETVIVPAAAGAYTLRPLGPCQVLCASVPAAGG